MAELYHPVLKKTITVPDESAWIRLRSGWVHASQAEAEEVAPDLDDAPEPELDEWKRYVLGDNDEQKES
jgi:hypothetical protein